MNKLIEIQKKIIPQALDLMERRYSILKQISINQPIGRRMLSSALDLSERTTRTEVDFLKEQRFIDVAVSGMTVTDKGKDLLKDMELLMGELMGITDLEMKLRSKLGIKDVVISKSINSSTERVMKEVAKCGADYFLSKISEDDIIAIAGGTTMRATALSIDTDDTYPDIISLPTRGSVGSDIDIQANSVADVLAKKLGAKVEFLYIPDELGGNARDTLMSIPDVKKTLGHLKSANKVLFSIGRADVMARRRGMEESEVQDLLNRGAIGEAFGYYFDKDGKVVMKLNTVGIDMDMYKNAKDAYVVFSGTDKVEAFIAMHKMNKNLSLITDEKSGLEILNKIS